VRYYDSDPEVAYAFAQLAPGRAYVRGRPVEGYGEFVKSYGGYVEVAFRGEDAEKVARALALMASHDLRIREVLLGGLYAYVKNELGAVPEAVGHRVFMEVFGRALADFVHGRASAGELGERWRLFRHVVLDVGVITAWYLGAAQRLKKIARAGGAAGDEVVAAAFEVKKALGALQSLGGPAAELRRVAEEAYERGRMSRGEALEALRLLREAFRRYVRFAIEKRGEFEEAYIRAVGIAPPMEVPGWRRYERRRGRRPAQTQTSFSPDPLASACGEGRSLRAAGQGARASYSGGLLRPQVCRTAGLRPPPDHQTSETRMDGGSAREGGRWEKLRGRKPTCPSRRIS
jgi:hypothetical protein